MIEKNLIKYIMPNILAMVGISCYIFADTLFISKAAGANGITALNIILPLYGLIYAIGAMIGVGSATRYSLLKGAGSKSADVYFSNAIIWSLIFGLILAIAGFFFPEEIMRLMGADNEIVAVGVDYTRIAIGCSPFFIINYIMTSFVRNDNAPKLAMLATIASGLFNIVLDYVLMFPFKLGMVGAAIATGLSPLVSTGICMVHFFSKKNNIRFVKRMPSIGRLISGCKLGVVSFIGEISSGITTMASNFILLDIIGNIGVAAYAVSANIAIVGMALLNGVAQGLQPLASVMHGAGKIEEEKRIYKCSVKIGLLISVILVGAILIFAEDIVSIFNSDNLTELTKYAVPGIRLYFLGFLMAAINFVKAGFYSATGMAREASVISILRGVIAIVVFAFVLSELFDITGVWLSFLAAEVFTYIYAKIILERKMNG